MASILGWEDANTRVSGIFFKAVVQAFLLFGSEMGAMTLHMVQSLGFLQHSLYRRIMGRQPRRILNSIWEYPHPPPLE